MSWIRNIAKVKPKSVYSQYGEDAFIEYIFANIGLKSKHFVDIGAHDGTFLSNTRALREKGWTGLMVDGSHENEFVKKHFITVENVLDILDSYNTPIEFDLLSIDIDGNDFWVLQKILTKYKPRVIISEYNAEHDWSESKAIVYDPNFVFAENDYYGYTFRAGMKLADQNGYRVIHQHSALNLFYLRKDEIADPEMRIDVEYSKHKWWGNPTSKEWVTI
jgi:hypothetical protein